MHAKQGTDSYEAEERGDRRQECGAAEDTEGTARSARPEDAGNRRNGISAKTVQIEDGPLRIEVPRDREGNGAGPTQPAPQNTTTTSNGPAVPPRSTDGAVRLHGVMTGVRSMKG
jgi:hypothetical protein